MISRRFVQSLLGIIWFIDGLLQLKPQMFTPEFSKQVILATAQGQPLWIATIIHWGGDIVLYHPISWDFIFALIQLGLGSAIIFNIRIRTAIIASLVWSGIVWIFGEGLGQLFTGQALLLSGAPGAVLIYGLIAIAIWPNSHDKYVWSKSKIRFSQYALATLYTLGCILNFQNSSLFQGGFSNAIAISWLQKAVSGYDVILSISFGLIEFILAVLLFFKIWLRYTIYVSILLSLVFWWIGQEFGQIFDPLSTDFNSGLLFVLLSICAYPMLFEIQGTRSIQGKLS